MDILSVISLSLLIVLIIFIILLTIMISLKVAVEKGLIKIKIFNIQIFQASFQKIIGLITKKSKFKINLKIKKLIDSLFFVGIEVRYYNEEINELDGYINGVLGILKFLNIKMIDRFQYKRIIGYPNVQIIIKIKFRLIHIILSQLNESRSDNYGKIY